MKLSTLQSTLAELGVQPAKSLGQNFLHDRNLADWIVAQLNLRPEDAWMELGPGLGALTEFAARRAPRGLLIEKDGRLATFLREGARTAARLVPIWGSAVSSAVAGAGTYAIGRSAIGYFIEGVSIKDARGIFRRGKKTAPLLKK